MIFDEISLARATASPFVWGLSFQLPEMKGLRASSCVEDLDAAPKEEGANALVDTAADRRVIADKSFMLVFFFLGCSYGYKGRGGGRILKVERRGGMRRESKSQLDSDRIPPCMFS